MGVRKRCSPEGILVDGIVLDLNDQAEKVTCKEKACKCLKITVIVLVVIAIIGFILVFVVFPLVYMNSIKLQRLTAFNTFNTTPKYPDFANFDKYNLKGAENLKITVNTMPPVSAGVWHILPEALANSNNVNFNKALADSPYPVILYFHGSKGHRITPIDMYRILRKEFHVITFDYRSYGDTTNADLTEEAVVNDCVWLYKWVTRKTSKEIFLWGRSLGAAISAHVVTKLNNEGIYPLGLFLEAPFTSFREQLPHNSFIKVFSWLPWFRPTFLVPLENNDFIFNTRDNMLNVKCPIMMLHAEDDSVVPYSMSEKLLEFSENNRNETTQGSIAFILISKELKCDHWRMYEAPELLIHIRNHMDVCREFHQRRKIP